MAPKLGKKYRFKVAVGKPDDPGFIPLGTHAVVDEVVNAEVDGAGDHEHDCVVVLMPSLDNRRFSHPLNHDAMPFDDVFEALK